MEFAWFRLHTLIWERQSLWGQWKSHFLKEGSSFSWSLQPCRSPSEKFLYRLHSLPNRKSSQQEWAQYIQLKLVSTFLLRKLSPLRPSSYPHPSEGHLLLDSWAAKETGLQGPSFLKRLLRALKKNLSLWKSDGAVISGHPVQKPLYEGIFISGR